MVFISGELIVMALSVLYASMIFNGFLLFFSSLSYLFLIQSVSSIDLCPSTLYFVCSLSVIVIVFCHFLYSHASNRWFDWIQHSLLIIRHKLMAFQRHGRCCDSWFGITGEFDRSTNEKQRFSWNNEGSLAALQIISFESTLKIHDISKIFGKSKCDWESVKSTFLSSA